MTGIAARIAALQPDVIVIDIENPNRDMLENMFQLSRAVKRPIAMFVDRSDTASIEAAVDAGVSAYVVDGLKKERVKPILDMAISRFNAFSRMERELEEARTELESRKTVGHSVGARLAGFTAQQPSATHVHSLEASGRNLRAGTNCGSCRSEIRTIIDAGQVRRPSDPFRVEDLAGDPWRLARHFRGSWPLS